MKSILLSTTLLLFGLLQQSCHYHLCQAFVAPQLYNSRQPLSTTKPSVQLFSMKQQTDNDNDVVKSRAVLFQPFVTTLMACQLLIFATPTASYAVSGGGLDFAGLDLTGRLDFESGNFARKDFTQVIAKGTSFAHSNLQGCRFYKAYLNNADFTDADLRGASLEDTGMEGATLKNALAVGAYFSASLKDVASLEGADLSDAQIPPKTLATLCTTRDDLDTPHPTTGVTTRDSLMCP